MILHKQDFALENHLPFVPRNENSPLSSGQRIMAGKVDFQ